MNKLFITILSLLVLVACSPKREGAVRSLEITYLASPAQSQSAEPFLFTYQDSTVYLSWIEKKGDRKSVV